MPKEKEWQAQLHLTDPVVSVSPAPRHDVVHHVTRVPEEYRRPLRALLVLIYQLARELDVGLEREQTISALGLEVRPCPARDSGLHSQVGCAASPLFPLNLS